jgi:hypothetical protein
MTAGTRKKSVRAKAANPHRGPSEQRKTADYKQSGGKRFAFTIDADTAQIVKFETVDASGSSHEISSEEMANLIQQGRQKLEQALEEAFEAGIGCVLGEDGRSGAEESAEDARLRHWLLAPLIEHSPARRLLQPEAMNRMLLETLIQRSARPSRPPLAGDHAASS